MPKTSTICVYCGSSEAVEPTFLDSAAHLGRIIARDGRGLVYGGGRLGLMGQVADGALSEGGKVVGIIPEHLYHVEVQNDDVTELLVVDSMHTRKAEMVSRSDGFCVLPGGIGTLDELIEILSWRQLALHNKPVVVVDEGGYYTPLKALLDHIVAAGFARPSILTYLRFVATVDEVLPALDDMAANAPEMKLDKI